MLGPMTTPSEIVTFRSAGYVVLRDAFDADLLGAEMDRAFAEGLRPEAGHVDDVAAFAYLPMMCERTPVSLSLLDALAAPAATLLGRPVLPGRAKGTRYAADTARHRDSEVAIPSIAFVAYLEPLDANNGALRVVPGSHLDSELSDAPFVAVATEPGDLIVFDEHLTHGSARGRDRRQWRVDYFADPADDAETTIVKEMFARVLDAAWASVYEVDRFPNYGEFWQRRERPWTTRLRDLGFYDLAAAQERKAAHS